MDASLPLECGHVYGLPRMRLAADDPCVASWRSCLGMESESLCPVHAPCDRDHVLA